MKLITVFTLVLFLSSCAQTKVIDEVEYDTFGIFSKDEVENPDIHYSIVWGNVIWGVILFETLVAPIYFFGFAMWEPDGPKAKIKGQKVRSK